MRNELPNKIIRIVVLAGALTAQTLCSSRWPGYILTVVACIMWAVTAYGDAAEEFVE